MNINKLQKYNFVSIHTFCCSEMIKFNKKIPLLFPNHKIDIINDPIRRVNFNGKVRMGEIEYRIYGIINNINENIKSHEKFCVNLIPLCNIMWIQQFKSVSPYLIKEAINLFKKIDLCIIPIKEELVNRNGAPSWFAKRDSKIKQIENSWQYQLSCLLYDNDIRYITWNKLFQIAQDNKL